MKVQIITRKWEKLARPIQGVGFNMIREFYANAWRPEEEKNQPKTYETMVRGVVISFAPDAIRKRPWPELENQDSQQRAAAPQQLPQQQPQPQVQQQKFPPNFYTHFDASMSQIYKRLDNQQEESRKSFEALNTRMDRFDDQ
ncbi:hypothetical protein PIB30_030462 [Stylosanthes scabra]|uniref:Uncharacterized protein n=1 Tax=Stylosanthes scabra TaxID=79078 RepID=A0ABU6TDG3_9FABA|nr:hypothetical protein [Stylosanthes scabra]